MAVTDANPDSFRRMDESTAEQWAHIGARTFENQGRVADRMIMLLESLGEISDGFITDQLTHCLQTATMAEKAGADDEMIFGALMHDVGTLVMAVCSLAMLKRIEPDFSDVVGWVGALAAGYSCHFARGLDVPRTVLPSHHAWSFFHGLFQWVLFYYTVVCTTPRAK